MGFIWQALSAIISTVTLGVVGFVSKKVMDFLREFKAQHAALMESQRNQLKASIVATYERVVARGWITPMELESVNREFDSYKKLGGNHYIHSLVRRMNEEIPVKGEPIPTD